MSRRAAPGLLALVLCAATTACSSSPGSSTGDGTADSSDGASGDGNGDSCNECAPFTPVRMRVVASNLTSGDFQRYDPGHGNRILQGVAPDIVLVQEMNYRNDSSADIRGWVDNVFGSEFHYYREPGSLQLPNGIVSRWPILASGTWTDPAVGNRNFPWVRIDIPGSIDLWAVSVHFLTSSSGARDTEAGRLVNYIQANVPLGDYLVIGGDLNTNSFSESALVTLSAVVYTGTPRPADQDGNQNTNANRNDPYDHVLVDSDLRARQSPVAIGNSTFSAGLVLDTRVYTPLAEISPASFDDSGASNMQHMAVIKDFMVGGP